MLLVHTSEPSERQRLQEEFRYQEGVIAVPVKQAHVLAHLVESITFEHFHNRTSGLAKMVQEYVTESLSLRHSLDLYRGLMREIKHFQEREKLYQDYLLAMNQQINQQLLDVQSPQEGNNVQEMESLPQQFFVDENRSASLLEMVDLPLLRLDSNKSQEEEAQSELTKNSVTTSGTNKETLDGLAKLGNFFYSASAIYSREEWKTQREPKQDSKQLNSFRKKGEGVIQANSSLCTLLAKQMAYDIKREILGNHPQKQASLMQERYKRRIKDTLLYGKIGLRRRK